MSNSLFTEIIIELKEKASVIPGKIVSSLNNTSDFMKKFTTEPFNYVVLQSIIFITLLLIIIFRDPFELYAKHSLEVTLGMLFLFFIMFSKYSQTDGDVIGYYAQAKFINNSKEKAEIFSVGSEVIINSK